MEDLIGALMQIGVPLTLLLVGYVVGSYRERQHYASIREREAAYRTLPTITLRQVPPGWQVVESDLVLGHVVISVDYFKRFIAGLRLVVGGRVRGYESILDRGRREALLRMQENALRDGFDAVVGVRMETSRLASGAAGGKGTAGVELVAFGTGLKLQQDGA